jgi:hypothetical protein
MARMVRVAAAGVLVAFSLSHEARAQLRADVGLLVGANKRFSANAPASVSQPGFGPSAELHAHVALMPLVRIGVYGGYEWSPVDPYPARHLIRTGLQLHVRSPFLQRPWRMWLSLGFGPVFAFGPADAAAGVSAEWGRFLELPVGLGLARRVWGKWEVMAEVLARPAFAQGGALFDVRRAGDDALGLGLAVGVGYDW